MGSFAGSPIGTLFRHLKLLMSEQKCNVKRRWRNRSQSAPHNRTVLILGIWLDHSRSRTAPRCRFAMMHSLMDIHRGNHGAEKGSSPDEHSLVTVWTDSNPDRICHLLVNRIRTVALSHEHPIQGPEAGIKGEQFGRRPPPTWRSESRGRQ